jgi:hypothetical protein
MKAGGSLDVRLPIEPAGDTPRQAGFRLLLERDARDQRGEGYFVRQGITIENPKARRPRGVRWILVVSDPTLSAFLGDAENPAHTEWQRSSPKFKAKYRLGPSTLDFVRSVPANVATLISRPAAGRDPDLLRHIFSLPRDAAVPSLKRPVPTRKEEDDTTTEVSVPATLGKNGALLLGRVRTGFRLRGRVDEEAPRRLEVLAAYDVLRGNPFRRYSPLDFRMDRSIAVQARGARVVARQENRVEIEIEAPEFEVLITRFDFGTVGDPRPPLARWLDGIPVRKPLFRVKVVLAEDGIARIVAAADKVVPEDSDRDEDARQSLLLVEYEDLGDRIWALDLDSDWPRLRLNKRFEGIREAARSGPEFLTLVYPEIFRAILERGLKEERFDPDCDDDWGTLWLRFACRELGRPRPPEESNAETAEWIDEAVNAFCVHAQTASHFERLLAERGD